MARRISDKERIIDFFMTADLALAQQELATAATIIKNRNKQQRPAFFPETPSAVKTTRTRRAKNSGNHVEVAEELVDLATV